MRAAQAGYKGGEQDGRGFSDKAFRRQEHVDGQKWKECSHQPKVAQRCASREAYHVHEKTESQPQHTDLGDREVDEDFQCVDFQKWTTFMKSDAFAIMSGGSGHERAGVLEKSVPTIQPIRTSVAIYSSQPFWVNAVRVQGSAVSLVSAGLLLGWACWGATPVLGSGLRSLHVPWSDDGGINEGKDDDGEDNNTISGGSTTTNSKKETLKGTKFLRPYRLPRWPPLLDSIGQAGRPLTLSFLPQNTHLEVVLKEARSGDWGKKALAPKLEGMAILKIAGN